MKKRISVSLVTKWLSNRHYLNEVPVEGKTSNRFFKILGYFDSYQSQVSRSGNCLTLLSSPLTITTDTFWKPHFLEDYARFVFFTFNKSFLLTLIHLTDHLKPFELNRAIELLEENPAAFHESIKSDNDEELQWCIVKNNRLKNDPKFQKMYTLDIANRQILLDALRSAARTQAPQIPGKLTNTENGEWVEFSKVLTIREGFTAMDTLQLIKDKLKLAEFGYDIFQTIEKGDGGRNQYGLNPRIGAMVDYFSEKNFFLPQCSREQIFQAYMAYTGNKIGKFNIFLSEYRKTRMYKEFYGKLKTLSVNKLKQPPTVIT